MYVDNLDWRTVVKNAEHYLAIGQTSIYLSGRGEDRPWEFVKTCEPGCSHRMEISTGISFEAIHPSGIKFSWSVDIEPREASGKGAYYIDVEGLHRIMQKVPVGAMAGLSKYLMDCAVAVEKKADEYQQEAQRQYGTASALRSAAKLPAIEAVV